MRTSRVNARLTRNGPREGGYGAKHTSSGAHRGFGSQSALGLRDAALHVSGSVNAGGMLTPNADTALVHAQRSS